MILQFFANLWYSYFSNDGRITAIGKSSWFLDSSWLIITMIAYAIANPDSDFANSFTGWICWILIGKLLSPLVLIPFATQLHTTKERLWKGAYLVFIPSFVVFALGYDKVETQAKAMEQAKGNLPLPPTDKTAHFGLSFFIVILIDFILSFFYDQPIPVAVILTAVLGLIKEEYDEREGGKWDNKDLLANAIGIILALGYLIVQLNIKMNL